MSARLFADRGSEAGMKADLTGHTAKSACLKAGTGGGQGIAEAADPQQSGFQLSFGILTSTMPGFKLDELLVLASILDSLATLTKPVIYAPKQYGQCAVYFRNRF